MTYIRNVMLIITGMLLLVKGLSAFEKKNQIKETITMKSVIRLHTLAQGYFFCSGTVVSKKYIITAAHCVAGAPLGVPLIEVRGADAKPTKISASIVGYNERPDFAVLTGDFSYFPSSGIVTDPSEIESIITSPNSDLMLCGYPYAGKLACSPFKYKYHELFQFAGSGFAYPGMSGGPLIDRKTGKVVAELLGVEAVLGQVSNTLVSPLTNIYYALGINWVENE